MGPLDPGVPLLLLARFERHSAASLINRDRGSDESDRASVLVLHSTLQEALLANKRQVDSRGSVNRVAVPRNIVSGEVRARSFATSTMSPVRASERLYQRLGRMGFDSAAQYATQHETASLNSLLEGLRVGPVSTSHITPSHLLWLLWTEAKTRGALESCARDLLFRRWYAHACTTFNAPGSEEPYELFTAWRRDLPSSHQDIAGAVHAGYLVSDLRKPWSPAEPDDPALVELVGRYWPHHATLGALDLDLGDGSLTAVELG